VGQGPILRVPVGQGPCPTIILLKMNLHQQPGMSLSCECWRYRPFARRPLPSVYSINEVRRQADESVKPLACYREEELEQMRRNFYGFDPSYHVARYNFVCKVPKSRTPLTIANHRWENPAWKQVS
jgi:hypothetical protein